MQNTDFDNDFYKYVRFSLSFFTRWIVTAAHCLTSGRDLDVYFGVNKDGQFIGTLPVVSAKQFIFPGYDPRTHLHDIGLFELLHLVSIRQER